MRINLIKLGCLADKNRSWLLRIINVTGDVTNIVFVLKNLERDIHINRFSYVHASTTDIISFVDVVRVIGAFYCNV